MATPESLRREQLEISRLAWAFALSLLLHLIFFGGYQTGKRYGWWRSVHWPTWIHSAKKSIPNEELVNQKNRSQEEIPLVFVEVSPEQATPEPPKQAKFYSNQNSKAANKETGQDATVPRIEGKNPELVKTEEVPREKFTPLQPVPPAPPKPKEEPHDEVKPAPTYQPGDLVMAKPSPEPPKKGEKAEEEEKHERPRTVQEAKARQQAQNLMPGQKMRLDGGLTLHTARDSLDAKATPFGNYDWALVQAIQRAWYALLDEQSYAADFRGKVMVRFHLHQDGNITELTIVENTAGWVPGAICETAIQKPKPYTRFPAEMRRVVGDVRSIQFTFFYD